MKKSGLPSLALGTALLALACSGGGGPTAIEIPVDRIEMVASCGVMIANETCSFRAAAFTADDQLIENAVLRWVSSNAAVATVEEQGTTGFVRARQSGTAQIIASNSTGSVSAFKQVSVVPENPK